MFNSQAPHILRMKAIYIFLWSYSIQYFFFAQVRRQRQLNQNPRDTPILVELLDMVNNLLFTNIILKCDSYMLEA